MHALFASAISSTKTGPFFEPQSRTVRTLSDTSHLSFLPLGSPLPGMSQGLRTQLCPGHLWSLPYSAEAAVYPWEWIRERAVTECPILSQCFVGAAQIFFLSNLNSGIFYHSG